MPDWNQFVHEHLEEAGLPPERESAIATELAQHLESTYDEAIAGGASPEEAHRRALSQIPDWRVLESELQRAAQSPRSGFVGRKHWIHSTVTPTRGRWTMLSGTLQDMRYGIRMLFKNPGFTLVAALTLALGIGANAAIFSVVYGILLSPLPYERADRLAQLWEKTDKWSDVSVSTGNYWSWREQNRSFEELAIYGGGSFALVGDGEPERLSGALTSANFFKLMRAEAGLGRTFAAGEDEPGRDAVVVLSHSLFERRFGGEEEILGQTINLNDTPHTVIGVMDADFEFPWREIQLWVPFVLDEEMRNSHGNHSYAVIGRLAEGVSREQAQQEFDAIAARLEEQYPESNTGWGVWILSMYDALFDDDLKTIMAMLFLSVGFVVLIACVNVANLLLARGATREKEFGVRLALGAGRVRLLRQLLTESLLLALLGGAAGVVVAYWGVEALLLIAPTDVPRVDEIALNGTVLLYTMGLSLLTGILFGLVPALQSTRKEVYATLKEGGRRATGEKRHRLLQTLVVAEVALSLALLALGGLMIRTFVAIQTVDPGFETANLMTVRTNLSPKRFEADEQVANFYRDALEEVRSVPGVLSASIVDTVPLITGNSWRSIDFADRPPAEPGNEISVGHLRIGPGYFKTMGIPLIAGREFDWNDTEATQPVVIVNQTLVRRYWPDVESPLGLQFRYREEDEDEPKPEWMTVVGVVGDVRHSDLRRPPRPEMYIPHTQSAGRWMTFLSRTQSNPESYTRAIKEAIWTVDPLQPVYAEQSMAAGIVDETEGWLATAQVMGVLALLALALTAVGIYGMVSYSVSERTHEIGVRMALGAQSSDILKLVVTKGLVLVLIGSALGLAGGYGLATLLSSLLFGVTTMDPVTYATMVVLLVLATLAASYVPARWASRVDPMVALRYE